RLRGQAQAIALDMAFVKRAQHCLLRSTQEPRRIVSRHHWLVAHMFAFPCHACPKYIPKDGLVKLDREGRRRPHSDRPLPLSVRRGAATSVYCITKPEFTKSETNVEVEQFVLRGERGDASSHLGKDPALYVYASHRAQI